MSEPDQPRVKPFFLNHSLESPRERKSETTPSVIIAFVILKAKMSLSYIGLGVFLTAAEIAVDWCDILETRTRESVMLLMGSRQSWVALLVPDEKLNSFDFPFNINKVFCKFY